MPPSPSLRCSPRRERGIENSHKRGNSFESGLPLKAKDDDLALFNDMQNNEQDNFLLHTSDDFEDSISKLRYVSDFKLGITLPVRGENTDLLNTDGEKNDYDWLLTPPDTPLFTSLDDDDHQPANLLRRGRPRSQPVTISRSLTGEGDHRASRSSASPRRLSPSPRSSNSLGQMRGRPSSAPRSSPPPVLRPATPSRRPYTPPNKPSTTPPRSLTPTFRRNSTGSSGQTSSNARRGASPVKASSGSSASPKLRGWQKNLDGLSNTPPNLRTSLPERPTAHPRGLSPSPRNGRDSSLIYGRRSMSPTASGSASSSHSHERDHLSTYSRGSRASSGDDDVDSLQSSSVGISTGLAARKIGVGNNKTMSFTKKPSRTISSSSAPKRSFDSALRQMDQRKIPQNMFRPLLSSVPATTFYGGKANIMHRPIFSRNSSLTTSSTASSEQGASAAHDVEASDRDQNVLAGEWERTQDHDNLEEIFVFEKVDEINEDDGYDLGPARSQKNDTEFNVGMTNKVGPHELENSMGTFGDSASIATASDRSYADGNYSEVGCYDMMLTCTDCGKKFRVAETNVNTNICRECSEKDLLFSSEGPGRNLRVSRGDTVQSDLAIKLDIASDVGMPELPEKRSNEVLLNQLETTNRRELDCPLTNCLPNICPLPVVNLKEEQHFDQHLDRLREMNETQLNDVQNRDHPGLKVDSSEGTGISLLLLQKSGSSKWPFVQGRAFSATNIVCSEPSYARDNTNATRCSFGRDTASTSSVDMGSSWKTDLCVQSELNSKKCEADKTTIEIDAKVQSIVSHSEVSTSGNEASVCIRSESEDRLSNFMEVVEYEAFLETMLIPDEHENSLQCEKLSGTKSSSNRPPVVEDTSVLGDVCLAFHDSDSHMSSHAENVHLCDGLVTPCLNDDDCTSCVSAEDDIELSGVPDEGYMLSGTGANNKYVDATKSSSVAISESENNRHSFHDLQTECMPSENPSNTGTFPEQSASTASEKAVLDSTLESNIVDHAYSIYEEATVTIEVPRRPMSRSFTLEEATDTILFCSSIIHDLAYKAANIGMEKEFMMLEGSRPTVTILGKSIPEQKDSRKLPIKNVPKSQKFKRKRLAETPNKPPELGDSVKIEESTPANLDIPNKMDSAKPAKLESKCNCIIM